MRISLGNITVLIILLNTVTVSSQQNIYSVVTNDTIISCDIENVYLDGFQVITKDTSNIIPAFSSLISEDHTAEGFMVTLSNGDVVNFFRIDPGFWGNHTGNNSRIVKRISTDNGANWGPIEEVFNDSLFDDRNVHGGLVGQDSIIIFFRRYEANYAIQIDLNYIYSLDGGNTWSQRNVIYSPGYSSTAGSNKIIKVPGRGWLMSVASSFYVEIRISQDGLTWNNNVAYVWNYTYGYTYNISEACFTYIGDGQIMGLFRNNDQSYGATYYQVSSADNGYTWSEPDSTNIASPFFCPAPQIFYDSTHKDLWVVATDRRNQCGAYLADSSSVWIYKNHVDDVFGNPMGYSLYHCFIRPYPNWYRLYGYSCFNLTADGNYLILFTESFKKPNFLEDADLYQFNIKYITKYFNPDQYSWNTGDTTQIVHADTLGLYVVNFCDNYGHCASDSVYVNLIKNIVQDSVFEINQGNVLLLMADSSVSGPGFNFIWSTGEQSQNIEVYPQENTTFFLTVNNGYFNCTDSVVVSVIPLITHIDRPVTGEFSVYPNPFTYATEIRFYYDENLDYGLELFDLIGQIVRKEEQIGNNYYVIERGTLNAGVYLLKLHSKESSFTSKIVITD